MGKGIELKMASKNYLRRHKCFFKPKTGDKNRKRTDHQKISQTLLATANSTHENASSLRVKTEVLNGMAPDDISFDAQKDLLIRLYGEYY